MMEAPLLALAAAAMTLAALHTLAPDHWVPFVAVARAQRWTTGKTLRVTALCGFGHVTGTVALAAFGLAVGVELVGALGARLEAVAGALLIAFGVLYGMWGLRQAAGRRLHGHTHRHYDHVHHPERLTVWSLFALFSADPCVAVIPVLVAAFPLGLGPALFAVVTYELATIGTMVVLVAAAYRGARVLRFPWLDRYGQVLAGATIAAVGLLVIAVGW